MRGHAASGSVRATRQHRHQQFHCGKPPPAALPIKRTCTQGGPGKEQDRAPREKTYRVATRCQRPAKGDYRRAAYAVTSSVTATSVNSGFVQVISPPHWRIAPARSPGPDQSDPSQRAGYILAKPAHEGNAKIAKVGLRFNPCWCSELDWPSAAGRVHTIKTASRERSLDSASPGGQAIVPSRRPSLLPFLGEYYPACFGRRWHFAREIPARARWALGGAMRSFPDCSRHK